MIFGSKRPLEIQHLSLEISKQADSRSSIDKEDVTISKGKIRGCCDCSTVHTTNRRLFVFLKVIIDKTKDKR